MNKLKLEAWHINNKAKQCFIINNDKVKQFLDLGPPTTALVKIKDWQWKFEVGTQSTNSTDDQIQKI